jgi:hypothetical protein
VSDLETFFAGVDLSEVPAWRSADELAQMSLRAFAEQNFPCPEQKPPAQAE